MGWKLKITHIITIGNNNNQNMNIYKQEHPWTKYKTNWIWKSNDMQVL